MTTPKRTLPRLSELRPGQHADFFAQLVEKASKTTRDGKPYFACRFRDPRRTAAVPIWADSPFFDDCRTHWQPGGFFKLRGRYTEHEKYGHQIEIEQVRPTTDRDHADGFDEADFADRPRIDPDEAVAALDALVGGIADEPLRTLVRTILAAHADRLRGLPGSAQRNHPYPGGWLDHTLSVTRHAAFLADRYAELYPDLTPPLNRDLVLAGAVLHDIGRVRELDPAAPGVAARAGVDGELFGHLLLGVELVREAAREVPGLNPELVRLLGHLIYTHVRQPERGSPRLPAVPEGLIVHHAAELDGRFEVYARSLAGDTTDSPFTSRDPAVGRPLYRGRTV